MESCKSCQKPLQDHPRDTNFAHKACNVRWDSLTSRGRRGKSFRPQEEACMKTRDACCSDDVPYTVYDDCT